MEELPVVGPYVDIGGWLLVVVLVVMSMVKGWLFTAAHVRLLIESYDKTIEEKNKQLEYLYKALDASNARADILADNQRQLMESSNMTNSLVSTFMSQLPNREPL